jgi:hypothetical protein
MTQLRVFHHTKRKAGKKHICCECAHNIQKCEIYSYISVITDVKINSYKQCNECNDLYVEVMNTSFSDDGPTLENLKDFFMDFADFYSNGNPDVILLASQFNVDVDALERLLTKPRVKS